MKQLNVLFLVCAVFFFVQCSETSEGPVLPIPQANLNTVDARVLQANNSFGLGLFQNMYQAKPEENIFVSPLSVSMALGMTLNGAEGETRTAMESTLAMQGISRDQINTSYRQILDLLPALDPNVDVAVANSIWSRFGYPVRQEFIDINKTYFDAEVRELDFNDPTAADIINDWVKTMTRDKIDQIVGNPIPDYVVMYLINAVYFKAAWTVEFDENKTTSVAFNLLSGSTSQVDMMIRKDSLPYYQTSTYAAVDLTYGVGAYAMTLLQPKQEGEDALSALVSSLNVEQWQSMTGSFREEKVTLAMPSFELSYEKDLNEILSDMGMGIAFVEGAADFSGINADDHLFISKVKHKSFIEVTEKGTEAAAATSVEVGSTSVDPDLYYFTLNRPFVFAIRERETGTILFMGTLMNPK
jgi:serine protease inhibitor